MSHRPVGLLDNSTAASLFAWFGTRPAHPIWTGGPLRGSLYSSGEIWAWEGDASKGLSGPG